MNHNLQPELEKGRISPSRKERQENRNLKCLSFAILAGSNTRDGAGVEALRSEYRLQAGSTVFRPSRLRPLHTVVVEEKKPWATEPTETAAKKVGRSDGRGGYTGPRVADMEPLMNADFPNKQ